MPSTPWIPKFAKQLFDIKSLLLNNKGKAICVNDTEDGLSVASVSSLPDITPSTLNESVLMTNTEGEVAWRQGIYYLDPTTTTSAAPYIAGSHGERKIICLPKKQTAFILFPTLGMNYQKDGFDAAAIAQSFSLSDRVLDIDSSQNESMDDNISAIIVSDKWQHCNNHNFWNEGRYLDAPAGSGFQMGRREHFIFEYYKPVSAYQGWLAAGHIGTEEEFHQSSYIALRPFFDANWGEGSMPYQDWIDGGYPGLDTLGYFSFDEGYVPVGGSAIFFVSTDDQVDGIDGNCIETNEQGALRYNPKDIRLPKLSDYGDTSKYIIAGSNNGNFSLIGQDYLSDTYTNQFSMDDGNILALKNGIPCYVNPNRILTPAEECIAQGYYEAPQLAGARSLVTMTCNHNLDYSGDNIIILPSCTDYNGSGSGRIIRFYLFQPGVSTAIFKFKPQPGITLTANGSWYNVDEGSNVYPDWAGTSYDVSINPVYNDYRFVEFRYNSQGMPHLILDTGGIDVPKYRKVTSAMINGWDSKQDALVAGEDYATPGMIPTEIHSHTNILDLALVSGTNTGDDATNSQYSGLATSKQDALNGTGFVKSTDGIISYDASTYTTLDQVHVKHGFPNRTDTSIKTPMVGSLFTLTKVNNYEVFIGGIKYSITTDLTCDLSAQLTWSVTANNNYGQWFVYMTVENSLPKLFARKQPWNLEDLSMIPVVTITWDGVTYEIGEERHSSNRNLVLHKGLHDTFGSQYQSGFDINPTFGAGSANNFSFLGGVINDDMDIANSTIDNDPLYITDGNLHKHCKLGYRQGGGAYLLFGNIGTTYAKMNGSTPQYDNAGVLTDIPATKYGVTFIYATNRVNSPIVGIIGQNFYNSVAAAQAAPSPSLGLRTDLSVASGLSVAEWKLLYVVIYQHLANNLSFNRFDTKFNLSTGPAIIQSSPSTISAGNVTVVPNGINVASSAQQSLENLDSNKLSNQMNTAKLLGRSTAGTGTVEEIAISGATLSNGTLTIAASAGFKVGIPAAVFDLIGAVNEPTLQGADGTNRDWVELLYSGAVTTDQQAFFEIPSRLTTSYAGGSIKIELNCRLGAPVNATSFVFSAGITGVADSEPLDVAIPLSGNGFGQTQTTINTATDTASDSRLITITIAANSGQFAAGERWLMHISRKTTSANPLDDFTGNIALNSVVVYE